MYGVPFFEISESSINSRVSSWLQCILVKHLYTNRQNQLQNKILCLVRHKNHVFEVFEAKVNMHKKTEFTSA